MGTAARPLTERVVLVVDDEDAVRCIVGRMLTDAGYAVEEARNGDEAPPNSTCSGSIRTCQVDALGPYDLRRFNPVTSVQAGTRSVIRGEL